MTGVDPATGEVYRGIRGVEVARRRLQNGQVTARRSGTCHLPPFAKSRPGSRLFLKMQTWEDRRGHVDIALSVAKRFEGRHAGTPEFNEPGWVSARLMPIALGGWPA